MGSLCYAFWATLFVFVTFLTADLGFVLNNKAASGYISKSKFTVTAAKDEDSNYKKENAVVEKGLTHLKYNKYAPPPEEAANMTAEEFRANIYKKMKEAEAERRKAGPIGNVNSDNYLDSLSRPPPDN